MAKALYIILTTYNRQNEAMQTIRSFQEHLKHNGPVHWFICDDGSPESYIGSIEYLLKDRILEVYKSPRRGVGHNMNVAINTIKHKHGGEVFLMLEDDWELVDQFHITPHVEMMEHIDVGMIRYGYLSPGLQAKVISRNNRLWFETIPNGYQYRFTGHPSLRHMRFHEEYGMYQEGLAPGETELNMCGKVNAKPHGPKILIPVYAEQSLGIAHHIGSHSLADIKPNE